MNNKILYSTIIKDAEALGGNKVSHDAVKKVTFQSLFKNCQGVEVRVVKTAQVL